MINSISAYTNALQFPEISPNKPLETEAPRFPEDDTVQLSQSTKEASPAPIGPGTHNFPDPGNG